MGVYLGSNQVDLLGGNASVPILVVNSVYDSSNNSWTLNKTWQEIYNAYPLAIEYINDGDGFEGKNLFTSIGIYNNIYYVRSDEFNYGASSSTDYPITNNDSGEIIK